MQSSIKNKNESNVRGPGSVGEADADPPCSRFLQRQVGGAGDRSKDGASAAGISTRKISAVRRLSRTLAGAAALAAASALSTPAYAQPVPGQGISVRAGIGQGMQRYELAWESPAFWSRQFDGSRLDLLGEAGVAYWHARHRADEGKSSFWQVSLTPMLRWSFDRVYVEAGVGPTLFSTTNTGQKEISTLFQIGTHLGAGVYLSGSSRLGLRASHFSNADIKRPNPGLNIVQLQYTHVF